MTPDHVMGICYENNNVVKIENVSLSTDE